MTLQLNDMPMTLADLRSIWSAPVTVSVGGAAKQRAARAAEVVASVVASGEQVYGINTGFGQLADVRIDDADLVHLQENLIRSHACGVGELLPDDVVRLTMVMKLPAGPGEGIGRCERRPCTARTHVRCAARYR